MQYTSIKKEEWDNTLEKLLLSYAIFAGIPTDAGQDYEELRSVDISKIIYNKPKPASPLKSFFLPVKENVTSEKDVKERIIIGIPNCDIEALSILDEIYLDKDFPDIKYRERRENTILISTDCIGIQEHCHCLTYDIKPFSTSTADLAVISLNGSMIIRVITGKGEDLVSSVFPDARPLKDVEILSAIEKEHHATETLLSTSNKGLPDYKMTGKLVAETRAEIWGKYSARCVSCGACTTICPTCTCFLLIDKPGFEKVKQLDACQYPGFERVAGGEDVLYELHNRFKNRYMCKYIWKPDKFSSMACTGCGRCIEACIGKINKNELFMELAK
jgi:sulfhydrogenase subunit beta (sulfur reductase)